MFSQYPVFKYKPIIRSNSKQMQQIDVDLQFWATSKQLAKHIKLLTVDANPELGASLCRHLSSVLEEAK